jgi:hypothetical protein
MHTHIHIHIHTVRELELMMSSGKLPMSCVNVMDATLAEPAVHRLRPDAYVTVTP